MEKHEQTHLLYLLKAITDEQRLTMIPMLHEREHGVGELAEKLGLSEPTISHHLGKLRIAGLGHLHMAGSHKIRRLHPRRPIMHRKHTRPTAGVSAQQAEEAAGHPALVGDQVRA